MQLQSQVSKNHVCHALTIATQYVAMVRAWHTQFVEWRGKVEEGGVKVEGGFSIFQM